MITACANDEDITAGSSSPAPSASASPSGEAGDVFAEAFPVTIEHARGETTIDSEPERVVTLGWSDQDPVLALGVTPVGTTEWFNEQPGAIFPWARDKVGDEEPEIVSTAGAGGEINFEKVAEVQPDLILALYEDLDQSEYDKLSKIAPTVAHSPDYDPFGASWQDMTLTTGRALGREEQAEDLIEDVEEMFAEAREEHPEWADQSALVMATADGGSYQAFSPQDPKSRFVADLGFDAEPPWLAERVEDNVATVSAEEAELLEVDRMFWTSDPALLKQLEDDSVYNGLNVVQEDRVHYLDYTEDPFPGAAVTFNSVLSIPYALDRVLPELEESKPE